MKAFSAAQMRKADSDTINSGYCSGITLMSNAGNAAADWIIRHYPGINNCHILTGRGNNGGDGFIIAARLAASAGSGKIFLHMTADESQLKGDALAAYQMVPDKVVIRRDTFSADGITPHDLIVDCLLGTGICGGLRDPFGAWINAVNQCPCPVIAIDIPSGLNADDGTVSDIAVRAQNTLTFAAPKIGLLVGSGPGHCGRITVLDIGIPPEILAQPGGIDVTDLQTVRRLLKPVPYDTYKQRRGSVLVIGGSSDYPSAPFLTAEAALRAGAGMVTVLLPASAEIVCHVPKAVIVRRVPDQGSGVFQPDALPLTGQLLPKMDAVAVGPGMTTKEGTGAFLAGLPEQLSCPAVFDADALNLLSLQPELLTRLPRHSVLTPHAGELKRLGGDPAELVRKTNAVCIVKGPYSAVTAADRLAYNFSGSPVLATAGSGDVLTGITAAFLAQKYDAFDAARISAFIHGLTGEPEGVDPSCNTGIIADDLAAALPRVLQKLGNTIPV